MNETSPNQNVILKRIEGQEPSKWNLASRFVGSKLSGNEADMQESWRVRSEAKVVSVAILKNYEGKTLPLNIVPDKFSMNKNMYVGTLKIESVNAFSRKGNNNQFTGGVMFTGTAMVDGREPQPVRASFSLEYPHNANEPVYASVEAFDQAQAQKPTTVDFSEEKLFSQIGKELVSRFFAEENRAK